MQLLLQIIFLATYCSCSSKCITIQFEYEDLFKLVEKFMTSDLLRRFALQNYKSGLNNEFTNPYHPEDNVASQEPVTLSLSVENALIEDKLERENGKFLARYNDKKNPKQVYYPKKEVTEGENNDTTKDFDNKLPLKSFRYRTVQ